MQQPGANVERVVVKSQNGRNLDFTVRSQADPPVPGFILWTEFLMLGI